MNNEIDTKLTFLIRNSLALKSRLNQNQILIFLKRSLELPLNIKIELIEKLEQEIETIKNFDHQTVEKLYQANKFISQQMQLFSKNVRIKAEAISKSQEHDQAIELMNMLNNINTDENNFSTNNQLKQTL